MIWYADTVDLMEKYSKRDYDKVMKTNYILISSRILTTKLRENVLNATNYFVSSGMLKGVRFETDPDSFMSVEEFKSFLLKNLKSLELLCSIIEATILDNEDTILLCSPNEMKCKYMEVIAATTEELFGYPICRYPEEKPFDLEKVLKRVIYYDKKLDEAFLYVLPDTEKLKRIQKMNKKELKARLKKEGCYFKGMTKEEMIDEVFDLYKKGTTTNGID